MKYPKGAKLVKDFMYEYERSNPKWANYKDLENRTALEMQRVAIKYGVKFVYKDGINIEGPKWAVEEAIKELEELKIMKIQRSKKFTQAVEL